MMRLLIILLLGLGSLPAVAAPKETTEEPRGVCPGDGCRGEIDRFYYEVLGSPEIDDIDPERAWRVDGLTVELDGMTALFEDGLMFPRAAVDGQVYGAVFLGQGRWIFETDVPWEKDNLKRRTHHESLDEPFTDALLQFTPIYYERLRGTEPDEPSGADSAGAARQLWRDVREGQRRAYTDFDILLAGARLDALDEWELIRIDAELSLPTEDKRSAKDEPRRYLFTHNGSAAVELGLQRYWFTKGKKNSPLPPRTRQYATHHQRLCRSHTLEEMESQSLLELTEQQSRSKDFQHVDAVFVIERAGGKNRFTLAGEVTVRYEALESFRSITFSLSSHHNDREVRVDSVRLPGGEELPFLHEDGGLRIELPDFQTPGEIVELTVAYSGELVDHVSHPKDRWRGVGVAIENYTLTGGHAWFPRNPSDSRDRFTWDWRIELPSDLQVAASGTTVEERVDGYFRTVVVKETVPSRSPGILFGPFTIVEEATPPQEGPSVRIFAGPGYVKTAEDMAIYVRTLVDFFEQFYGVPYPYEELDVVQAPVGIMRAMALPGLVQIDGAAYIDKDTLQKVYRYGNFMGCSTLMPHEVAHQWWGHTVVAQHCQDSWLIEAMASISAALYLEALGGLERYQKILAYWGYTRKGYETGKTMPLYTAQTHGSGYVRTRTIYGRGPLMMHELRSQLGTETFLSALQHLARSLAGQRVTTEEFRLELEAVTGRSLDDFFDLYLYSNAKLREPPRSYENMSREPRTR